MKSITTVWTLLLAMSTIQTPAWAALTPDVGSPAIPMPGDTRLVMFNYDPHNSYTVLTRPQAVTNIQLAQDEQLKAFALGDTVQWITDKTDGHIFIKPIKEGLFTSATIVTTKRTYQITLRSSAEKGRWYQRVSWNYPDMIIMQQQQMLRLQASEERESRRIESISAGPVSAVDKLNFSYDIDGSAAFRPQQVFDDGKFTWIRIEGTQELPAVFMLNSSDKAELVNYVVKGDFIVIQRLTPGLLLKLGDEQVTIRNRRSR